MAVAHCVVRNFVSNLNPLKPTLFFFFFFVFFTLFALKKNLFVVPFALLCWCSISLLLLFVVLTIYCYSYYKVILPFICVFITFLQCV